MKKNSISILLFLLLSFSIFAQQFYNYNSGGSSNSFPFNIYPATGKTIQVIYPPGAFNNPGPVTEGNITKVYFRASSSGNATYTSLKIRVGLTTDVAFNGTTWYTGSLTTVYNQTSVNLVSISGSFFSITLTTPFFFDVTKSLVIEVEQCGFSGSGISLF